MPIFTVPLLDISSITYIPPGGSLDTGDGCHWRAEVPPAHAFNVQELLYTTKPISRSAWPKDLVVKVTRAKQAPKQITDALDTSPDFVVNERLADAMMTLVPDDVEFLPATFIRAGKPIEGYRFMHVHRGVDCIYRKTAETWVRADGRVAYSSFDITLSGLPLRPFIGRLVDKEVTVVCSPEVRDMVESSGFTGIGFLDPLYHGRKYVK